MKLPPQMVMLTGLHKVWPDGETFVTAHELVRMLISENPDYWDVSSAYGRSLTVQRLGRILVQVKVRSSKNPQDQRGYQRSQFEIAWRQSGITPRSEPSRPSEPSEPSNESPETPVTEPIEPPTKAPLYKPTEPTEPVKPTGAVGQKQAGATCPRHGTPTHQGMCGRCAAEGVTS